MRSEKFFFTRNTDSSGTVEVDPKGTLVDEHKLRSDFSWNGPVTPEQMAEIELIWW
jgi:hypothetical protein